MPVSEGVLIVCILEALRVRTRGCILGARAVVGSAEFGVAEHGCGPQQYKRKNKQDCHGSKGLDLEYSRFPAKTFLPASACERGRRREGECRETEQGRAGETER